MSSCHDSTTIDNKAPFLYVNCTVSPSSLNQLRDRAGEFSKKNNLSFEPINISSSGDKFSILMTDKTLNIVVTSSAIVDRIFVSGISRAEPTSRDRALLTQFLAIVPGRCTRQAGSSLRMNDLA